ncbi:MAG: hypothetical protein ABFQ64_07040 [Campylobacterota bacterium]
MKKIHLVSSILLSINLHGADKAKCEELFRSAIFNFYLENSCKFNKHISSAIRKEFGNQNCTEMFSDNDMKKLNSDVLGESYQKMKKVGRDDFCRSNKNNYDKLQIIYLESSKQ